MKNRILKLLFIFIPVIIVSGCLNTAVNKNDMGLDHIREKYGENCEYGAPWGGTWTPLGTHEFLVNCESFEEYVLVEVIKDGDGYIFRDNYFAIKYQQETENFFLDSARQIFGSANVYYRVTRFGDEANLPANTTFNDFLARTNPNFITVRFELKSSDFTNENQVNKLTSLICDSIKVANLRMQIVVVEDDLFDTLDNDALDTIVVRREHVRFANISRLDGSIDIVWR